MYVKSLDLAQDSGHCGKRLKGELEGLWSLRVGRHRVIYRPDDAGAEVIAIGPRTTIYEETTRHILRDRLRANS